MSLINDALNRAKQTQPGTKPTPEMETTMKPAPPARTVGLPGYFLPVLLFIISGACWFLVKGWDARRQSVAAEKPVVVHARETEELTIPKERVELPIPENRQFSVNDDAPGSASAAAPATTTESIATNTAQDAATGTTYKLQGIFYRPTNPSAVVNARTVFVGDRIANAKVKAIDQQSVTLEVSGETKVLTLQ
jgi:hypothetical protein